MGDSARDNNAVDFRRYVAFISDNPSWPGIGLLRRRAEAALWKERLDPRTVRGYFDKHQPLTTQGKFALARAVLLEGDRADAQSLVREAWRYDNFSGELEAQILDVFRDLITDADHKARMDIRLYAEDIDGAMRAANRAGGNAPVIMRTGKARQFGTIRASPGNVRDGETAWWGWKDSNLQPHRYERSALTVDLRPVGRPVGRTARSVPICPAGGGKSRGNRGAQLALRGKPPAYVLDAELLSQAEHACDTGF